MSNGSGEPTASVPEPSANPLAVLGHEDVRRQLTGLSAGTLLFAGPEGVGRRRTARWYAALLNCASPEAASPCGRCESCRLFTSGHPDYRELSAREKTAGGKRTQRPEIRIGQLVFRAGETEEEPLAQWLERRPRFRRRVAVIDGAERMTVPAANSFLKMLEEPPSYARIILVAASPRSVLPTVASRCSTLRFAPVDTSALGSPDHPAHRLGRPGPLLAPLEEDTATIAAIRSFFANMTGELTLALAAGDELAARWREGAEGIDLVEALRERLRELPPEVRTAADDLVLAAEEAIAGYSPPQLVTRVLLLELRSLLRETAT